MVLLEGELKEVSADVVIVGSGPTGLVTALLLAGRGHQVALVERWPSPYPLPRAVGINHESVRVMQNAGVIDAVMPLLLFSKDGSRLLEMVSGSGEVLASRRDSAESASGWPERATFSQPRLEGTLNEEAAGHPLIELHRGWEVVNVVTSADTVVVEATATDDDSRRMRVQAHYVVGCDGANSIVRQKMQVDNVDLGFSSDWLVTDVIPNEPRTFTPELGPVLGPPRPTAMCGGGAGRRRWEFMRLEGETKEELGREETAWRLLAKYDINPSNAVLERHAVYTFRGLWASQWVRSRSALAGDAAHLMPPFLGEGFNSGTRDARALSWRLDLVLRGVAPATLIDSYSPERIGHVRRIVEQAVEIGRLFCITDPEEAARRDDALRAAHASGARNVMTPHRWRLGPGLWDENDPRAGYLGIQGQVERDGAKGFFDQIVGHDAFVLLSRSQDPLGSLPDELIDAWRRLGGISAHFGPESQLEDLDGTYARWFEEQEIEVALLRPDHYVFGTSATIEGAQRLLDRLFTAMGVAGPTA